MSDNKTPRALGSSERRWGVLIRCYYRGKLADGCPFLAGRFYFHQFGDRRAAETSPPTATFLTRAQARLRCAMIRAAQPGWRVTARAVPVLVTTTMAR